MLRSEASQAYVKKSLLKRSLLFFWYKKFQLDLRPEIRFFYDSLPFCNKGRKAAVEIIGADKPQTAAKTHSCYPGGLHGKMCALGIGSHQSPRPQENSAEITGHHHHTVRKPALSYDL